MWKLHLCLPQTSSPVPTASPFYSAALVLLLPLLSTLMEPDTYRPGDTVFGIVRQHTGARVLIRRLQVFTTEPTIWVRDCWADRSPAWYLFHSTEPFWRGFGPPHKPWPVSEIPTSPRRTMTPEAFVSLSDHLRDTIPADEVPAEMLGPHAGLPADGAAVVPHFAATNDRDVRHLAARNTDETLDHFSDAPSKGAPTSAVAEANFSEAGVPPKHMKFTFYSSHQDITMCKPGDCVFSLFVPPNSQNPEKTTTVVHARLFATVPCFVARLWDTQLHWMTTTDPNMFKTVFPMTPFPKPWAVPPPGCVHRVIPAEIFDALSPDTRANIEPYVAHPVDTSREEWPQPPSRLRPDAPCKASDQSAHVTESGLDAIEGSDPNDAGASTYERRIRQCRTQRASKMDGEGTVTTPNDLDRLSDSDSDTSEAVTHTLFEDAKGKAIEVSRKYAPIVTPAASAAGSATPPPKANVLKCVLHAHHFNSNGKVRTLCETEMRAVEAVKNGTRQCDRDKRLVWTTCLVLFHGVSLPTDCDDDVVLILLALLFLEWAPASPSKKISDLVTHTAVLISSCKRVQGQEDQTHTTPARHAADKGTQAPATTPHETPDTGFRQIHTDPCDATLVSHEFLYDTTEWVRVAKAHAATPRAVCDTLKRYFLFAGLKQRREDRDHVSHAIHEGSWILRTIEGTLLDSTRFDTSSPSTVTCFLGRLLERLVVIRIQLNNPWPVAVQAEIATTDTTHEHQWRYDELLASAILRLPEKFRAPPRPTPA